MYILYRQELKIDNNDEIIEIGNAEIIEKSDNFEQLKELALILKECEILYGEKTTKENFIAFYIQKDSKKNIPNNIC